jgi:hypothetical protein
MSFSSRSNARHNVVQRIGSSRGISATGDNGNSAASSAGRWRNSRSPDRTAPAKLRTESSETSKPKRSGNRPLSVNTIPQNSQFPQDEITGDRGRKSKSKVPLATQSRQASENMGTSAGTAIRQSDSLSGSGQRKERGRSKSRDGNPYVRRQFLTEHPHGGRRDELHTEMQSEISSVQMELEATKKVRWHINLYYLTLTHIKFRLCTIIRR